MYTSRNNPIKRATFYSSFSQQRFVNQISHWTLKTDKDETRILPEISLQLV